MLAAATERGALLAALVLTLALPRSGWAEGAPIEVWHAYRGDEEKALQRIVIPSALRRMIPSYSNEVILMLQGSAIASAVTLVDLTGAARNVYSRHFAPFESFVFVGLIYLALTFALVGLFKLAEHRWLAHLAPRKAEAGRQS